MGSAAPLVAHRRHPADRVRCRQRGRFLTVNNDTRVFFSEENPELQALEALEDAYSKIGVVFFALAPENGEVFTRQLLVAVEELTESAWEIPHSSRVDSIISFQYTRADKNDLIVEDLVRNAATMSGPDLQRTRKIAVAEPEFINRLISPIGHVTGVYVSILLPGESLEEVSEVAGFTHELAAKFRRSHPDIDLYVSSGVIADDAFGRASQRDMATLLSPMFLALIIIVGVALRSFTGTLTTPAVIVVSMISGMGLAAWIRIFLQVASCCTPGTRCSGDASSCACVGERGADLGIVPSTVSHHIKGWVRVALIRTERRG